MSVLAIPVVILALWFLWRVPRQFEKDMQDYYKQHPEKRRPPE